MPALGAGTAGKPAVATVVALGKGQGAIKVASSDLLASFLESVAAGDAAIAVDQQQFLQGHLARLSGGDFLALRAEYGLKPGGNVAFGPNLITAGKAAQMVELFANGDPSVPGAPVKFFWFLSLAVVATWILLRTPCGQMDLCRRW